MTINNIEKKHFHNVTIPSIVNEENIEKYNHITQINLNFTIIVKKFTNKELINGIIKEIPLNSDDIKGFINNYKKFLVFLEQSDLSNLNTKDDETSFYKLCYIMGFFNTGGITQEEAKTRITNILKRKIIVACYDLTKYYKEYANLLYNHYDELDRAWHIIYAYRNFPDILKWILNKKKHAKKENNYELLPSDIQDYYLNRFFDIKEKNLGLLSVVQILSGLYDQKQFDSIQEIYEKSYETEKNHLLPSIEEEKEGIHYQWLASNNPVNTILGYKVGSCAVYDGVGQDIMVQSMNNIHIKNLVIHNNKEVIGKAAAYYNEKENYLLFNTFYVSQKFLFSLKTTKRDKENVLDALLRGMYDIGSILDIKDIRIGLGRNCLCDEIIGRETIIMHDNLLKNYPYENYEGDANSEEGQAVILQRKR